MPVRLPESLHKLRFPGFGEVSEWLIRRLLSRRKRRRNDGGPVRGEGAARITSTPVRLPESLHKLRFPGFGEVSEWLIGRLLNRRKRRRNNGGPVRCDCAATITNKPMRLPERFDKMRFPGLVEV